MKHGRTLQELAIEIERQNKAKADYIADTREIQMTTLNSENSGTVSSIEFGGNSFIVNGIAHSQFADKLKIPQRYYDRMRTEQPALLDRNVNTWLQEQPSRRMIRTLDDTARAFLSEKYRRIDNYEIASEVLPIIGEMQGAKVESCEITDSKMYLKIVNPKVETEIAKGDVVQSGLIISNSEVGMGSVSVMPLIYRLVCSNGMIAADHGVRKFHVGRANEADDDYKIYATDTVIADEKAFMLKLRDVIKATADITNFEKITAMMKESTGAKITSSDIPSVVRLAAKDYGILEREQEGVLNHLIRNEEMSLYGLVNAITRQAQEVESYDRSTDLEIIAFDMLSMSRAAWNRLNAATAA
jgi:hypothetical protein